MKLGGWNVSHISQYSCFQCLHLPKQPTIWCIVQKNNSSLSPYCWTNSSLSAFISFFFSSFFLQSTGILVYNDGPHVSSGSSWTRCLFLCHCVLHVCCKQTKECAFPHPVSRLLCLCSAPLSLMKLLHVANRGGEKKCLVLKVWIPQLKCSLRQTQTLLLGFSLPPVYRIISFCLFLLPETPPAEGVDFFFFFGVGKKTKTCCGGRVYRYEGGSDLSAHHSSSSSVGVCLSLKDVAALKKHRFTLVSVLGSDQIELSFFIFVCLHCISPTDSNLIFFFFFACACAEFEGQGFPCWMSSGSKEASLTRCSSQKWASTLPVRCGREPVRTACDISPVSLDHQLIFFFFPPFD